MIQIDGKLFFLTALMLLLLPLDWVLSAAVAAVFHEMCHLAMLYAFGGKVRRIHIRSAGCEMESSAMGEWQQFFSIFAGPLGSFSLLLLCRIAPKIAICGFFHGAYNLIPVLPLDGGRLLCLLLYALCPKYANRLMAAVAFICCAVVSGLCFRLSYGFVPWPLPLIFSVLWNIKYLPRKIPCKPT